METITVGGIQVKIVRKRVKNMYLRLNKDNQAVISAPVNITFEMVKNFALSKEEWLKKAISRMADKNNNESLFCDGEERTLFGKKYILHLDTTKEKGYYFRGNDLVLCVGENSSIDSRRKALAKVYREVMEEVLPENAELCQKKCGLYAEEWRIKDMKTRWGSCNTKEKRIWINLWLVEKNPICLRAVIYHELAHLRYLGHNKAFYKYLHEICPDYDQAERLLKNGPAR
jgi:predicted metal-dependent hydrolase